MEYRTLGNSGAVVSNYALGTMTFGAEADEAASHAILDNYLAAGGNFIDTADVYTAGASEEIIGRWLAARPGVRDAVVLASKGRFPMGGLPNDVGTSRRHLTRALDDSLRRLGVDHIDLYQMHAWDPITPVEETLRFLHDAVTAGKIGYYGFSNFLGWQLTKAVHVARSHGWNLPVTLQPQYSLLVRGIEAEIVPAAQDAGMGLLPWSPLGGGWLSGKYVRDQAPAGATRLGENPQRGMEAWAERNANPHTWDVVAAVSDIAAARGTSPSQVALAWVAGRPGVTSVILGARTTGQLADNLGAAELALTAREVDQLTLVSEPDLGVYPYGPKAQEQRSRKIAGGR
ncbi:aryl-alcohol dehydrogenase (NADP+) [Arthrobacter stackebrandtii]|uniref:Aryl-alcohol dehydrogenase (NADP+) n=1 Tax=Arthrobacter stackebrandtii TaxID=272161 RepID=A0ABS4Z1J0_9MICC|nr:aldo/keto reductase [Arthrobacter stackebrandtii]MBP2414809.1 aryl-alcohol dehydrogenase (NADP+) [Arthrobacter stackebrandtii]PYG99468.1 aldo/keto reductase [Arthrobacter stackebrandtii]